MTNREIRARASLNAKHARKTLLPACLIAALAGIGVNLLPVVFAGAGEWRWVSMALTALLYPLTVLGVSALALAAWRGEQPPLSAMTACVRPRSRYAAALVLYLAIALPTAVSTSALALAAGRGMAIGATAAGVISVAALVLTLFFEPAGWLLVSGTETNPLRAIRRAVLFTGRNFGRYLLFLISTYWVMLFPAFLLIVLTVIAGGTAMSLDSKRMVFETFLLPLLIAVLNPYFLTCRAGFFEPMLREE